MIVAADVVPSRYSLLLNAFLTVVVADNSSSTLLIHTLTLEPSLQVHLMLGLVYFVSTVFLCLMMSVLRL